ncbi:M20 family metallo-hydrolase [Microbacterium marinilacus]|nr:M20 family metallo-hydrolase [Microbacterium marinilacus]
MTTDEREYLDAFEAVSRFGATPRRGVDREAGTPADGEMRRWLRGWLAERGFRVGTDAIGNVFGLIEWTPGAPFVLTGSHLDSQPLGGRYDGAYGVIASACAAARLARRVAAGQAPPPYNVAVVDWFNEEGSRFPPSMMGSSVFTGKLPLEAALAVTDARGISVADALDALGERGDAPAPAVRAYAEVHVEQGRVLEDEGTTIGLVTSTWAARKFDVTVDGEQSHTGSTVMADRCDALVGAAHLVLAVRELAQRHADGPLHTSVARFDVEPNSPVVVPRRVRMNIDLRSPDPAVLDAAERELDAAVVAAQAAAQVEIHRVPTHAWDRQPYQAAGVGLAREAAAAAGLSHREIMTIAGHDSTNMKDVAPTVMLFVPSVDGVAHNEGELTPDGDCLAGVELLTEVLARLCAGAEIG